jgi:hypothetical protein
MIPPIGAGVKLLRVGAYLVRPTARRAVGRPDISKATVDRCSRTVNSHAPEICFHSSFDCFLSKLKSEEVEARHVGGLDRKNDPLVN